MKNEIILSTYHGSKLYGLEKPDSDIDIKRIYIEPIQSLILNNKILIDPLIINTDKKIDTEFFTLSKFFKLCSSSEMIVLDILGSKPENWIESSDDWEKIYKNKKIFFSQEMIGSMSYVKKIIYKYQIKIEEILILKKILNIINNKNFSKINDIKEYLPISNKNKIIFNKQFQEIYLIGETQFLLNSPIFTFKEWIENKIKNFNKRVIDINSSNPYEWKSISHAIRIAFVIIEILKNEDFSYPLKESDFILKTKLGQLDFKKEIAPKLEELIVEIDNLKQISKLPKNIDQQKINNFLLDIYLENYRELK